VNRDTGDLAATGSADVVAIRGLSGAGCMGVNREVRTARAAEVDVWHEAARICAAAAPESILGNELCVRTAGRVGEASDAERSEQYQSESYDAPRASMSHQHRNLLSVRGELQRSPERA
jgi:hypothetical protein